METPALRHFQNGLIISDPVQALIGEAWVQAVLCQREDGTQYWATPDLSKLPAVTEWRDEKEGSSSQSEKGNGRVQARNTAERKTGTRQGAKSKKPKASDCNSAE